ncbi:MAG TPA: protein kinase [Caldimonas sp.]|nr:protein kinase [Caldimonas sp.]
MPVRDALSPGTRLDEFEIVRVLGTGGFGIVYLARDHVLQRDVAIKEYMPAALAGRGEGATVSLRSHGFAEVFAKGLESFLSEARLLASFDHRSLVKVHRFWRGNATAYMAMQHYPGRTLKDARLDMTVPPGEAWLDAFVDAILGVLDLLHDQGVYHRDISPDNILLLDDGSPVLLDLGSARRVMADSPQSFTAHLKPQFAPIEQYAEEAGGMQQGPWTDLYALGATLYFVITGRAPTPSVVRAVRDTLPSLAAQAGPTMPNVRASLLATIDWTLCLAPEQRPQNVQSVRRALKGEIAPPPPSPRQLGAAAAVDPGPAPHAVASAEPAQLAAPSQRWFSRLTATFWSQQGTPDSDASHSRRRTRVGAALSLALLGLVALAGGAWTFNRPSPQVSRAPAPAHDTAPAATARVATASPSMTPASTLATTSGAALAAIEQTASPAPTPAPVRPVALSDADSDAAWVQPADQQAMNFVADATSETAAIARRPAVGTPQAASPPARDRHRATRAKVQTASAATRPSRPSASSCDASGLLGRAWCALNPCKAAAHGRANAGRANPECMERLRAEASRQQRVERQ